MQRNTQISCPKGSARSSICELALAFVVLALAATTAAPARAASSCGTTTSHLLRSYVKAYNDKDVDRLDRAIIAREPAFRYFRGPDRPVGDDRATLRAYLAQRTRRGDQVSVAYYKAYGAAADGTRYFKFTLRHDDGARSLGRGFASCAQRRIVGMELDG